MVILFSLSYAVVPCYCRMNLTSTFRRRDRKAMKARGGLTLFFRSWRSYSTFRHSGGQRDTRYVYWRYLGTRAGNSDGADRRAPPEAKKWGNVDVFGVFLVDFLNQKTRLTAKKSRSIFFSAASRRFALRESAKKAFSTQKSAGRGVLGVISYPARNR